MIRSRGALLVAFVVCTALVPHAEGHDPSTHRPGAPQTRASGPSVTVELQAKVQGDLPWRFWPDRRLVRARRGETVQVLYQARNLSERPVTAKATHRMVPEGAEAHLELVECFCFVQATLAPGEERTFPLAFRLSPTLPRRMSRIVLRYEFAPDTPKGLLAAASPPPPGMLEVWVRAATDQERRQHPVWLSVPSVGIEGQADSGHAGWFQLPTSADPVALDARRGATRVLRGAVPAGQYRAVRVEVVGPRGPADGASTSALLRSDPVPVPFTIAAGGTTALTLDLALWDAVVGGAEVRIAGASVGLSPPASRQAVTREP